jgi:hypothetical protein
MDTSSRTLGMRRLLAVTVVAAVVGMPACKGADGTKGKPTAGAADSSRPGGRAGRTTAAVPRLPKKLEQMTAEDFIDVINGVDWTGHLEKRDCDDDQDCTHGNKVTWVRHEAAVGANDLAFDTLPENGMVVARLQNIGRFKEARYQLPAGKGEWYQVLTPGADAQTAIAHLVNLHFQGNGTPKLDINPTPLMVTQCEAGKHDTTDAGFKDCPTPPRTAATSPDAPPPTFNRGAWFTCSLGCCTTEGVRGLDSARADSARRDSAGRASTKR